jgi:1,2-phenylacetyl-CoA epoxidase catalytic subunit
MAYDEVRHADICRRMIRHFGGQEEIDKLYAEWDEHKWLYKMDLAFTQGPDDFVEFLTTVPLLADITGIYIFADMASESPDPLWADAAESISQDERMHSSIGEEFLPIAVEKYGDRAIESIERGLERWMPIHFGGQGQPDSPGRQRMIDRGLLTLTTRDVHDLMYEHMEEVLEPLGVDVPRLEEDKIIRTSEVADYAMKVLEEDVEVHGQRDYLLQDTLL